MGVNGDPEPSVATATAVPAEEGDSPSLLRGHPRFRPLALLGRGSMGDVYKVHDNEIGIAVALKTLHDTAPEQIYRLKHEFRALAGVVHPNLVQLFELLIDDELRCFTMELIDGSDFIAYVAAATVDERLGRFLDAAIQLLCGLRAVHAVGRLHRDVKPSNLRVARDGRVVLLDFDLAVAVGHSGHSVLPSAAAGTFAYMPPETLWGKPVGPAADLYSVGVVFYEALSGRLPYDNPVAIGPRKPPPIGALAPWVPSWLEELTLRLLEADPERRPPLEEALHGRRWAQPAAADPDRFVYGRREFLGREMEMAQLRAAYERAPSNRASVVLVTGSSGMGKSELVRRFLDGIALSTEVLALHGRCHPHESVPYKALDAIIDGLSRFLSRLPESDVRPVLPPYMGALARIFPVLGNIVGVRDLLEQMENVDATELRRRAFTALRELLAGLAERRRLVFWIDDLQWGDGDSAALLADILRPPDAPRLLLLLSYRREEEGNAGVLRVVEHLSEQGEGVGVQHVEIGPLHDEVAVDLARRLCPLDFTNAAFAAMIAREARGVPFMIAELARYAHLQAPRPGGSTQAIDFSNAIGNRIGHLPIKARRLVELIAVAGAPVERSVVLQASQDGEPGRAIVALLESEGLVRSTPVGDRLGVEAYHDRIRESVLARLADDQLRDCHRALAVALEASAGAQPEMLSEHFHGAAMLDKAADYALAAASKANEALAFVRAAEFYRKAREWDARDESWRRTLLTQEGEALSNAAHFEEASQAFRAAVPGATRVESIELQRRAAEQMLAAGRFDEGTPLLADVLRELGLRYPRSPRRAVLAAVVRLLGIAWTGIEARPAAESYTEDLARVDACYSAGKCLVNSDSMRGVYFSIEALHHALRAGEPIRLGCSLAVVGGSLSVLEGPLLGLLGRRMMDAAAAIAAATQSPLVRGTIDVGYGQVRLLQGRWQDALEHNLRGAKTLVEHCRGAAYESVSARRVALRALDELGDIDGLARLGWEILRAAVDLKDRYSEVGAAQQLSTALLAADDTAQARKLARTGFDLWTEAGFLLQHFYSLRQQAHCDLYAGRAGDSFDTLQRMWKELKASGLTRLSLPRIDAFDLRGRLAIAVANERPAQRATLHALAQESARQLRREAQAHALVRARLLEAALHRAEGRIQDAIPLLAVAADTSRQSGMILLAAVADYRRSEVVDTAQRADLLTGAMAIMRRQGVVRPERWVATYAPVST